MFVSVLSLQSSLMCEGLSATVKNIARKIQPITHAGWDRAAGASSRFNCQKKVFLMMNLSCKSFIRCSRPLWKTFTSVLHSSTLSLISRSIYFKGSQPFWPWEKEDMIIKSVHSYALIQNKWGWAVGMGKGWGGQVNHMVNRQKVTNFHENFEMKVHSRTFHFTPSSHDLYTVPEAMW